jgi:hypothetical protein
MAGSEDTGVSLKNRCWTEAVDPSYIDSGRASGCTPHPFRGQVEAGGSVVTIRVTKRADIRHGKCPKPQSSKVSVRVRNRLRYPVPV